MERERVGLCWDCAHARRVATPKGSTFFLCGKSAEDRTFAKYPRLPVVRCVGCEPHRQDDSSREAD